MAVTTIDGRRSILNHAQSVLPTLDRNGHILKHYACLRPVRTGGLRIDLQVIDGKKRANNVAHGGSGYTEGPGSALASAKQVYSDDFSDIEPPFEELNAA